jgi:hypothetical protein
VRSPTTKKPSPRSKPPAPRPIKDKAARNAAIKAYGEKAAKIAAQEKELAPAAAEAAKLPAADKAVADATPRSKPRRKIRPSSPS